MGWTKDARVKGVNNSDAEKYAIDILRLSINFIIHILDITLFPFAVTPAVIPVAIYTIIITLLTIIFISSSQNHRSRRNSLHL